MSDKNVSRSYLQFKLNIESPSLKYAAKSSSRRVLFAVEIPYPILRFWNDLVEDKDSHKDLSSNDIDTGDKISYIDLLEQAIPNGVFAFRDSSDIREDINESLRKICSSVKSLYKKVF